MLIILRQQDEAEWRIVILRASTAFYPYFPMVLRNLLAYLPHPYSIQQSCLA